MSGGQRPYQPLEAPAAAPELASTSTSTEYPTTSRDKRQLKIFGSGNHVIALRYSLGLLAVGLAAVLGCALAGSFRRAPSTTRDEENGATIFLEAEHSGKHAGKHSDRRKLVHPPGPLRKHKPADKPKPDDKPVKALKPQAHHSAGSSTVVTTSSAEGTWEIVYDGAVDVRSEKNETSKIIGRKRHGDVVIGQREGNWLSLACEVGYVKIEDDSEQVVKERAQSYTLLSEGSCMSAGKQPVSDIFECEVAAASIGLSDIVATVSVDGDRPQGCFVDWNTEKLWLDTNPKNAGNGALGKFQPLCLDAVASRCEGNTSMPAPPEDTHPAGQSTDAEFSASCYCFEVLVSENKVEVDLVREQYRQHAGVFDCEEWNVFGDSSATRLSPPEQTPAVYTTRVPAPAVTGSEGTWGMWYNASAMLRVWNRIHEMGRYKRHDFVVKVDPTAVFVAQRLRINLQWYSKHQHLTATTGAYFRNCLKLKSMAGAIEVFSRPAIEQFYSQQQACLGIQHEGMPEDTFMSTCMDLLKMKTLYDWNLLSASQCGDEPAACDDKFKVVFHPFQDLGSFSNCLLKTIKEG